MQDRKIGSAHGSTASSSSGTVVRYLHNELKDLTKEPVEGFIVEPDTRDVFKWRVGIFGPPDTIYQGGYFKAELRFPVDYPFSPPTLRFLSPMWHPNVYKSGDVCISILHAPGSDPQSGEHPDERWNPSQSVRTVLMSVISLLNEPNTFSPANVDASVAYRKWVKHGDKEYEQRIKEQVERSKQDAIKDEVKVPDTVDSYCIKTKKLSESDEGDADEDYYEEVLDDDSEGDEAVLSDSEGDDDEDNESSDEGESRSRSHNDQQG